MPGAKFTIMKKPLNAQINWRPLCWLLGLALALPVSAGNLIQDSYRVAAKQENPSFEDFSVAAGRRLYTTKVDQLACASCHTDSPMLEGRHVNTNTGILPMAPAANPKRFTDTEKVERWFDRDCRDVFKRACSAKEKGDLMAYLLSR